MLPLSLRPISPLFVVLCIVLLPCGASPQGAGSAPVAAAGLSVPSTAVPWALDEYKGKAELVPVHHANIVTNRHMGKNIAGSLAGSFLYRPEMTTELEGEHARAQLHTASPVIYFHVDTDEDSVSANDGGDRHDFQLVPAKIVKGRRVVDAISFNQLTTHAKRKDSSIA